MAATVAVALKWVDLHPTVDPLTGAVTPDAHGGLSAADQAALAVALQLAGRMGTPAMAVTVGPSGAEAVLRHALEAGCAEAVRVNAPADLPSAAVAAALADVVRPCAWALCGDASLDRGSGSVPAFLAGHVGWAQALGAAAVAVSGELLVVERRLERGRREVLEVDAPAVVSVEAGVAAVPRPSLAAAVAARSAPVTVMAGPPHPEPPSGRAQPFRPRPRVLEGPDPALSALDRQVALSGALAQLDPPRVVHADPGQAAEELLAFLRDHGYPVPEA